MLKKKISKTPSESTFTTRKIVAPDMLNPNGTLFGGVIMSWMDEVAFMSARRYAGVPFVVTASVDNITFINPIRLGEHIVLTSSVNYVGRSSMEIGVKVEREDPYSGDRFHTNSAYFTFVSLDKKGRPKSVPQLSVENDEDIRRFEEARFRVKVRSRLRARLKRKLDQSNKVHKLAAPTQINKAVEKHETILRQPELAKLSAIQTQLQAKLKRAARVFFFKLAANLK